MLMVIIVYALTYLGLEIPGLIKRKQWQDLGVGSALLLAAIGCGLETTYTWNLLPDPDTIIAKLNPMADAFFMFFHLPLD